MILALEQYKQSTAEMRDKLTEIAGGLHLDDLRRELEELREEMNADGFWNDLDRSTHVNRRIAAIEGKIKHYESLVSAVDDLEVMIDTDLKLAVRFGDEPEGAPEEEDGREVVYVGMDSDSIEMDQIIYDYICLSVPLHKVHEDGGCDPEVLKYIKTDGGTGEKAAANNPFSALKGLLDKKL